MASNITEQPSNDEDETFDLYDLRVEVVCPPGARILCGASPGDYFTLEGTFLQGKASRSTRSVRAVAHALFSSEHDASYRGSFTPPRRETTCDRPRRLDDHGRGRCVP